MNYAEFKTFVSDYLWRQNDADLTAAMDNIVRMSNSELDRKLNIQRREVSVTIAPTSEDHALPADFRQIISLTNKQRDRQRRQAEFFSTNKSHIEQLRAETNSQYIEPYYYPQRGQSANILYLVGPFSVSEPGSFDLTYRTSIPDYETADASWVADDYLDLYLYTVMKHCAIFLREEERIQTYAAYMQDALDSAVSEDNHEVKFGGSPLKMKFSRHVPQTRRR